MFVFQHSVQPQLQSHTLLLHLHQILQSFYCCWMAFRGMYRITLMMHSKIITVVCVEFLPPNTTALLQPLDVLINRTFKSRLRQIAERWRLYQLKYSEIYSDKKKRPSPSKQELAQFILWAWDSIQAKTIRAAFKKAKLIENEHELPGEEEENDSKIDVEKYVQYFQPHKPTAKK